MQWRRRRGARGPALAAVLLSPSGRRFDQRMAEEYAAGPGGLSLLCGRYEGVDQRVADHLVDEELSVGDFVLAGGELAALVVVEAVVRLLPGVLGNDQSASDESFTAGLLEYPQYTRPATSGAGPCPRCSCPGTMAASTGGAGPRPSCGPCGAVPT